MVLAIPIWTYAAISALQERVHTDIYFVEGFSKKHYTYKSS